MPVFKKTDTHCNITLYRLPGLEPRTEMYYLFKAEIRDYRLKPIRRGKQMIVVLALLPTARTGY